MKSETIFLMFKVMNDIDKWGIDIFLIDELTLHRPLTAVVYTIFQVKFRNLIKILSFNFNILLNRKGI